jgi:hypothetical protein
MKQSRMASPPSQTALDCFAELVIGPATSGRTRWLAMTHSCGASHFPSPPRAQRVAGRGQGWGAFFEAAPPTPAPSLRDVRRPSPPLRGGREKNSYSRDASLHPSFAAPTARKPCLPNKEGRRSAERRIHPMAAPHIQALPPEHARGAAAGYFGARSPSGAPPRHSPHRTHPVSAQLQTRAS